MPSAASTRIAAVPSLQDLPGTLAGRALLAVGATLFVATCAHVSLPLYFTPVPFTLQTFAVLLIGLVFGPALGAATLLLYLAEGAAGLPVFSPQGPGGIAQLLGPTGGYLLSYPLAAAAAGLIARWGRTRISGALAAGIAGLASTAIVLACGAAWLSSTWLAPIARLPHAASGLWTLAVLPFLPGEAVKIAAASAAYSTFSRWRRS
jgi:biotin transport system substrate-specific component